MQVCSQAYVEGGLSRAQYIISQKREVRRLGQLFFCEVIRLFIINNLF